MANSTAPALILEPLPGGEFNGLALALNEARLPFEDLVGVEKRFFSAIVDDVICGYCGLEVYGEDALLRSAVIFRHARRQGLGRAMVTQLIATSERLGVRRMWLLTETAADFFTKLGFTTVGREQAPPAIAATAEFAVVCPGSATFMVRPLQPAPPVAADG